MDHRNAGPPERGSPADRPDKRRTSTRRRLDLNRGALAGALAAVLGLAVALLLRGATETVTFLDAAADAALAAMPMRVFSMLLKVFGAGAKAWLLAVLLAGFVALGAVIGWFFARGTAGSRRIQWLRGLTYAAFAFGALAALILARYGGETGGPLQGSGPVRVLAALALAALAFGIALPVALALLRRLDPAPGSTSDDGAGTPTEADPPASGAAPRGHPRPGGPPCPPVRSPRWMASAIGDLSRRRFLTRAGLGVTGLAGLVVLGREVARVRSGAVVMEEDTGRTPEPITPNDEFYVVSKNFRDPDPDRDGDWTLKIDGAVERSLTLTRSDLVALAGPAGHEFVSTLTCISNPVGGPLISTARWTGVPLPAVLAAAGVQPETIDVVFHGRDGYTDAIPLAKAQAPETALVWAMNGVDLPRAHGYPLRAIVPGLYGIKNVKWLERIELVAEDHRGYWQRRGWTDDATIKTMSRIDAPRQKGIVPAAEAAATGVAGIAFAGDRDISRVDVSLDDGDTWHQAAILEHPSPLSWAIWRLPWQPEPGTHTLQVRATDGTGILQTPDHADPLPDGASGWHTITAGIA